MRERQIVIQTPMFDVLLEYGGRSRGVGYRLAKGIVLESKKVGLKIGPVGIVEKERKCEIGLGAILHEKPIVSLCWAKESKSKRVLKSGWAKVINRNVRFVYKEVHSFIIDFGLTLSPIGSRVFSKPFMNEVGK